MREEMKKIEEKRMIEKKEKVGKRVMGNERWNLLDKDVM